jgi:hypothetical protein
VWWSADFPFKAKTRVESRWGRQIPDRLAVLKLRASQFSKFPLAIFLTYMAGGKR